MVDKPKRLQAAALIQEFLEGRLTNFGFADRLPRSSDQALRAIYSVLWFSYDDLREHRLEGKRALTAEGRDIFQRCILFLMTDLEYRGRENFVDLGAPFKRLWYWITRQPGPQLPATWPFENLEQLEQFKHPPAPASPPLRTPPPA